MFARRGALKARAPKKTPFLEEMQLMEEIRRSPVEVGKYPIIYRVSYMSGGARFLNHQPSIIIVKLHLLELLDFSLKIIGIRNLQI